MPSHGREAASLSDDGRSGDVVSGSSARSWGMMAQRLLVLTDDLIIEAHKKLPGGIVSSVLTEELREQVTLPASVGAVNDDGCGLGEG